jgi:hypothetical protein
MNIHSCSYYCDRPECIKAQRDEFVKKMELADDSAAYHGWVLREVLFDNGEPVGHREPQPTFGWVGLTDDEIYAAIRPLYCDDSTASSAVAVSLDEYRVIEKALKEKNT